MSADVKTWFDLSISRGPVIGPLRSTVGLILHVYADPAVEEYMNTQSSGSTNDLADYGGIWTSVTKNERIKIYNTPKLVYPNSRYTLDAIGKPLLIEQATNLRAIDPLQASVGPLTNLSFLKIVGISNPEGVKFGITGAYSKDYLDGLKKTLIAEAKQLMHDFVVPISINLRIVSKV